MRKYSDQLSYWISESDGSMYEALNKGLQAAKGEIVGIVNSDDALYDEYTIHDVIQAFRANPEADGIYGDQVKEVGSSQRYKKVFQVDYFDYFIAGKGTFVPHGSLFLRRSLIEKIGGYDTAYRFASDYDFILRALQSGILRYAPIPISRFRVHDASITSSGRLPRERDAILAKHAENDELRLKVMWRRHLLWTRYRLLRLIYLVFWPIARAKRARLTKSRHTDE